MNDLFKYLESARIERKIHKTLISKHTGISTQYYYKLLSGECSPKADFISKYADYLGFTLILVPKDLILGQFSAKK